MIGTDERARLVIVIVVSVLMVAGTSLALKVLDHRGIGAGQGRYDRVSIKYAGLGKPVGYSGYGSGCTYSGGSGGGCNSSVSGASCCGGGGSALNRDEVKAGVLRYYAEKYGDSDVTCEVEDYGCHMEAAILKEGNVVRKLSISGNRITEI